MTAEEASQRKALALFWRFSGSLKGKNKQVTGSLEGCSCIFFRQGNYKPTFPATNTFFFILSSNGKPMKELFIAKVVFNA